jgi:hypothetical protein
MDKYLILVKLCFLSSITNHKNFTWLGYVSNTVDVL